MTRNSYKVWVNIESKAAARNFQTIKKLLKPSVKLWAVVKSNAYGHGLVLFSKLADRLGVDGFCVDSVIEGLKLREAGITKPVLVLGPTLFPNLFAEAATHDITITVSNFETLKLLLKSKQRPKFHLKIDTGMHRQGFYLEQLPAVIREVKSQKSNVKTLLIGLYTHFASAKDINYPTFTDEQFAKFQKAVRILAKAGYKNIVRHCAATGAAIINPKYHLDVVRIGIGLYGLWPSRELEIQLGSRLKLQPVLSWHSLVSEVKDIRAGDYIGYDLTERATQKSKIAVVPIGYWHGFDRGLSGIGEVMIRGRRCRVLGRVSMDLIVVDAGGIDCRVGDRVVLLGNAADMALKIGTTPYEIITRINPLIERIVV